MGNLKRIIGVGHILAAIAVALQQMFSALFEGSDAYWDILNPVMFVAIILVLIFTFLRKRENDATSDVGVTREYLESNVMFYLTSAVAILFTYNWVRDLISDGDGGGTLTGIIWTFVNITFILISAAVGAHWLRTASK